MYLFLALLLRGPNLGAFLAFPTDTLTQIKIWAHSANIPASCVWIDTPYAYVWTTWNFHFIMGGSNFEVKINRANCQKCCEKNYVPFLRYKRQSNQVLPQLFLDSNWFHHYLVYSETSPEFHNFTLYWTVLHSTAQFYTLLHSFTLYSTGLHSTAQFYTLLHCSLEEYFHWFSRNRPRGRFSLQVAMAVCMYVCMSQPGNGASWRTRYCGSDGVVLILANLYFSFNICWF
jgi:hypothetical protein